MLQDYYLGDTLTTTTYSHRTRLACKYDMTATSPNPTRQLPSGHERVNETRATREKDEDQRAGHVATLFDYWQSDEKRMADSGDGWRNKLIWGDNLYVMSSLLEHFAGKVDLIYIDPPFATGADFSFSAPIGQSGEEIAKEQSAIEEKAYRDTWGAGRSSFLQMIYSRMQLMRDLLSDQGSIYVHLDWNVVHYVKAIMDEVFGDGGFLNEVIHCYGEREKLQRLYNRKHQTLLFYVKNPDSDYPFNAEDIREEFADSTKSKYKYLDENGWYRIRGVNRKDAGRLRAKTDLRPEDECEYTYRDYRHSRSGPAPRDWFIKPFLNQADSERLGYPTQKNPAVLERVIKASSNEGDLIADFFGGSGTTLAVAERLGRRWIGCDLSRYAVHVTRKRLMGIPGCRPFEVLNLGKYERQVWQGVTFGDEKRPQQLLIFEYLKFILELYGAQPLAGMQHIHGKRGSALVHVGAVDAPVTIDEINACLAECQAMGQKELCVLGWEWEMGMHDLIIPQAKRQGVKLLLLNIPREVMEQQAVDKGDIQFYELAYLETDIKPSRKNRSYTVELTGFVIPNDELIPPEVRERVKKWSDYVDYWAVDWNFRTTPSSTAGRPTAHRRDRNLQLKSDPHVYEQPGSTASW